MLMQALSTAGSLASSALDYSNAEQNRSFQRSMDSTRYQRGMADMKKAGLNPILAAGGIQTGAGSGSPMGKTENPINSALMAKNIMAQTNKLNAEADLARNKGDMTDPIAQIMDYLGRFIGTNKPDDVPDVNSALDKLKNFKKFKNDPKAPPDVIRVPIEKKSNSAKSLLDKIFQYHRNYRGPK